MDRGRVPLEPRQPAQAALAATSCLVVPVAIGGELKGCVKPRGAGSIASAVAQFGLQYVRGCEVIEVRDEGAHCRPAAHCAALQTCGPLARGARLPGCGGLTVPAMRPGAEGTLMNDFTGRVRPDEWKPPKGTVRTVTVAMDTAQYQVRAAARRHRADMWPPPAACSRRGAGVGLTAVPAPVPRPLQMDMNQMAKDQGDDVYGTFNMLMRRKAKARPALCTHAACHGTGVPCPRSLAAG